MKCVNAFFFQLEAAEGPSSLSGKTVVAVATGGNVTPEELQRIFRDEEEEEEESWTLEGNSYCRHLELLNTVRSRQRIRRRFHSIGIILYAILKSVWGKEN